MNYKMFSDIGLLRVVQKGVVDAESKKKNNILNSFIS